MAITAVGCHQADGTLFALRIEGGDIPGYENFQGEDARSLPPDRAVFMKGVYLMGRPGRVRDENTLYGLGAGNVPAGAQINTARRTRSPRSTATPRHIPPKECVIAAAI